MPSYDGNKYIFTGLIIEKIYYIIEFYLDENINNNINNNSESLLIHFASNLPNKKISIKRILQLIIINARKDFKLPKSLDSRETEKE